MFSPRYASTILWGPVAFVAPDIFINSLMHRHFELRWLVDVHGGAGRRRRGDPRPTARSWRYRAHQVRILNQKRWVGNVACSNAS